LDTPAIRTISSDKNNFDIGTATTFFLIWCLFISPVRDEERRHQLLEALGKANTKYGCALKKLAD
jgi:hypothetical protein